MRGTVILVALLALAGCTGLHPRANPGLADWQPQPDSIQAPDLQFDPVDPSAFAAPDPLPQMPLGVGSGPLGGGSVDTCNRASAWAICP